jgi:phosphoribosylformylglycinamidine (FGAM) synthase PurS component
MELDIDKARIDLEQAAVLDPENKAVQKELKKLEAKEKAFSKKEAKQYAKMFG